METKNKDKNICDFECSYSDIKEIENQVNDAINNNNIDFLNSLINDKDHRVRCLLANKRYRLDKLIEDDNWIVRNAVARQNYGLNRLIKDKSYLVRITVASNGYGLEQLVNDDCNVVRMIVADKGIGLDKLICDKDPSVREIAIKKYNLRLENYKNERKKNRYKIKK